MATFLLHHKGEQWLDSNGDPLAGGKLRYDRAGTSTLLTTYSDSAGTVPNTQTDNRIILDSAGRLEEPVYIDDSFDAKETLYTSADVIVDPWPFDNIPKAVDLTASLSDFAKPLTAWTTDSDTTVNLTTGNLGGGRLADTSSNSITYNLPSASASGNGKSIVIKKTSASNTVTVDGNGSETIDGSATFSWTADDRVFKFTSDGANWQVEVSYLAQLDAASDTSAGVQENAVQSEMETASSTTLNVVPGRQHFHPGHPKAWGYVTVSGGTPTLQTSYNITSITDTGAGLLTVTIATDFSSANYSCVAMIGTGNSAAEHDRITTERTSSRAAGSVLLVCDEASSSSINDPDSWNFAMFGDQ